MTSHPFTLGKGNLVLTGQQAVWIPEALCRRLHFRRPSRKLVTVLILALLISSCLLLHFKQVLLGLELQKAVFFVTTGLTLISDWYLYGPEKDVRYFKGFNYSLTF
jgi:hypothetical protein